MYRFNREEFDNYTSLYKEAYALVKSISPQTKIGASFLYTLFYAFEQVHLPDALGDHDFIAFTSYLSWIVRDGHFASIEDIPAEWYGWARSQFPDTPLIFSEVGWASSGTGTPEAQAEYVRSLPRLMSIAQPELITWALLHDVEFFTFDLLNQEQLDFLLDLGVDVSALFERFNAMGLREGNGMPKPAWSEAVNLDFSKLVP